MSSKRRTGSWWVGGGVRRPSARPGPPVFLRPPALAAARAVLGGGRGVGHAIPCLGRPLSWPQPVLLVAGADPTLYVRALQAMKWHPGERACSIPQCFKGRQPSLEHEQPQTFPAAGSSPTCTPSRLQVLVAASQARRLARCITRPASACCSYYFLLRNEHLDAAPQTRTAERRSRRRRRSSKRSARRTTCSAVGAPLAFLSFDILCSTCCVSCTAADAERARFTTSPQIQQTPTAAAAHGSCCMYQLLRPCCCRC